MRWARQFLSDAGIPYSESEIRELVEWATGSASVWHVGYEVPSEAVERFQSGVYQRRQGIPLQHVTGRMYFRSLTLTASPGVFVVRPETESIAQIAIDEGLRILSEERRAPTIVDLCTGSGAIACALATEVSLSRVWAVELDERALRLAEDNIQRVGAQNVTLIQGDAGASSTLSDLDGAVDIVVSNPPYVPFSEAPLQREAQADPPLALYGGGEDGMDTPRRIITRAASLLNEGGLVVIEHSPSQSYAMREAAEHMGFTQVSTVNDLAGRQRGLVARKEKKS